MATPNKQRGRKLKLTAKSFNSPSRNLEPSDYSKIILNTSIMRKCILRYASDSEI